MTEPQHHDTPAAPAAPAPAAPVPAPAAPAASVPAPAPAAPAASVPAAVAATGTGTGSGAPAPVEPPRRSRRKALTLVAAGVAAAVLAGGGIWAAAAMEDADRTAPTAYWVPVGERVKTPDDPAEVPANALTGRLLPLPGGYVYGPDLGADGNNFHLSGEKAVEGFKEARNGLSRSERKKRDDMLAELKLKGLAGRSYAQVSGEMIAEVRVMQADPQALGSFSEVSKKLLGLTGDGRDAPKVDGFPDAKCSLLAVGEEKKEKIDSVYCVAVEGDVMVNFRAYGPKPGFAPADAVAFFKNQLSHLKSPGESV
ncbi:hypothetical protein [Streptomyces sp. cmx-4-9]|uniref:hypothetical protein n=1 Tax=Streptomyces sp. cmx-4-9 TaxID=2790941 RepID=UPI00397EA229